MTNINLLTLLGSIAGIKDILSLTGLECFEAVLSMTPEDLSTDEGKALAAVNIVLARKELTAIVKNLGLDKDTMTAATKAITEGKKLVKNEGKPAKAPKAKKAGLTPEQLKHAADVYKAYASVVGKPAATKAARADMLTKLAADGITEAKARAAFKSLYPDFYPKYVAAAAEHLCTLHADRNMPLGLVVAYADMIASYAKKHKVDFDAKAAVANAVEARKGKKAAA